jgi:glycosyltransferase involved in cell wall biosynthesis
MQREQALYSTSRERAVTPEGAEQVGAAASIVKSPTVSVVIPLFNKRRTLGRTLASILAQTFTDYEVIVVDDGSTDGGGELIAGLDDPRFRLVAQANAGPGAAKNRGAAEARADTVAFLDADDEWDPRFLEIAVAKLSEHPECDVFCSDVFLGGDRRVTLWTRGKSGAYCDGPYRLKLGTPGADVQQALSAFSSCGNVYRRSVVLQYDGFFAEGRCTYAEDVYLWIQVYLNHSIYCCTTPLGCYHMEDSELAIGTEARRNAMPLEPALTHADAIRRAAPTELREWLEEWMAWHAMNSAFLQLGTKNTAQATWLMREFPAMKRWRSRYLKLWCRSRAPRIYASVAGWSRKLRAV